MFNFYNNNLMSAISLFSDFAGFILKFSIKSIAAFLFTQLITYNIITIFLHIESIWPLFLQLKLLLYVFNKFYIIIAIFYNSTMKNSFFSIALFLLTESFYSPFIIFFFGRMPNPLKKPHSISPLNTCIYYLYCKILIVPNRYTVPLRSLGALLFTQFFNFIFGYAQFCCAPFVHICKIDFRQCFSTHPA